MKEFKLHNIAVIILVDDDEDLCRLQMYKYNSNKNGSIQRREHQGTRTINIALANDILQNYTVQYDHKNRNPYDFTRNNLRPCTQRQNCRNRTKQKGTTSKYKGVSWNKRQSEWTIYIMLPYKRRINLGHSDNELKAALIYDKAARKHFKQFAVCNFCIT